MAAGPVTVQVSTTRPPTGGPGGARARPGRARPGVPVDVHPVGSGARPDGICGDCGRRYPSPTVPVEAA